MPASLVTLPETPHGLADELVELATPCDDTGFANNARGVYNPDGARHLLDEMLPVVEKAAGRSLTPNCTFCRVYGHGSVLQAHTDRDGLDWTVSVTLRTDAPWSIEVEESGRWLATDAGLDEGVLINGSVVRHRRSQPFPGTEAVVLLLHYTERGEAFMLVNGLMSPADIVNVSSSMVDLQDATVCDDAKASDERIASIAWLRRTPEWQWVYERLRDAIAQSNVWGLDIAGASPDDVQFARYGVGGKYDWHIDRDESVSAKRTMSMVVLLKQPEAGGGFELKRGGVVPLDPGDACVFPSRELHRALPVVRGTRETLTLWLAETN